MLDCWGFDFANPSELGWSHSGGTAVERSSTTFRNGTHAMRVSGSNTNYIAKVLDANYATLWLGLGFYAASLTGAYARQRLCSFIDDSSYQIVVTLESNGSLRIWRGKTGGFNGATTSLQQTSSGLVTANSWNHLIVIVTFNTSTGSYEVRLNGTSVLSGTGVNTSNSGNAYAGTIGLGDVVPNGNQFFDDVWVSSVSNQGDCKVETLYANANGSANNFNVVGAASNILAVDDPGVNDGDSTYTFATNVNDKDVFGMTNLVTTAGTVKGVKASAMLRKDDAGTRQIALVVGQTGGGESTRTTQSLTGSYVYYQEMMTQEPSAGVGWTIAKVNSMEVGAKIIA